ncbi:MAG: SUMF1/EgtB/PvdO family nonheme iron enzyme [Geminicoccaceae bacterium]
MPAPAFDDFLADLGAMLGPSPDEAMPTAAGPGLAAADGPAPSQTQISPAAVPPVVSEPYPGVGSDGNADGAPERASVPAPPFVADAPTVLSTRVETDAASPPARDPSADEHSVPQPDPVDAPARPRFGSARPPAPPPKRSAGRLAFAALLSAGAIGVGAYIFTHLSTERPPATVEAKPARLQPDQMFTDTLADGSPCPFCPEMVVISAGSFTMGSPLTEVGRDDDEGPQQKVTFTQPFALGRYEVTFAQWDACVAAAECNKFRPDDQGWGRGSQPVIDVSWQDAQGFVTWLSGKTGRPYRLPTEAEWEYAARAGTTKPFWTGSTISTAQANYDGNYTYGAGVKSIYRARTVAVDDPTFPANPFGLYHMHGNVWEWVQDCYHSQYDEEPMGGSNAVEASGCPGRVLRGGSWNSIPRSLRSAFRFGFAPDVRDDVIGFRVARMLTP